MSSLLPIPVSSTSVCNWKNCGGEKGNWTCWKATRGNFSPFHLTGITCMDNTQKKYLFLNSLWNEDMLLNENHAVAKVYPSYKNTTLVQGLSSREHCKSIYNYITQMKLIIMSGGKTQNWEGIINSTYRFFSSSPYSGWCVSLQEMDIETLQFFKLFPFFVLHKILQQVQGWNETWEEELCNLKDSMS